MPLVSLYKASPANSSQMPECDDFRANIITHQLQSGERILLCSDGLNEALDDAQIASLFANESDTELLDAFKVARQASGTDDFSAIILSGK